MTQGKPYLVSRVLIGLMALIMAAATLPAYADPTLNPGLAELDGPALSLGQTAGAFLGRQLTLVVMALIGAVGGQRSWVLSGALGMMLMNGHDAVLMGLMGGPPAAAAGGLVFALLAALAMALVWRTQESGSKVVAPTA